MASQRPSAEHDGRLTDPKLRETSFERAFAYDRLRSCFVEGWTAGEVVRFHSSEKLLLLSRDPQTYALLRHHVVRFNLDYIAGQSYLNPRPTELTLRSQL